MTNKHKPIGQHVRDPEYVSGEPLDTTIQRFQAMGIEGDHLMMCVMMQRGEMPFVEFREKSKNWPAVQHKWERGPCHCEVCQNSKVNWKE